MIINQIVNYAQGNPGALNFLMELVSKENIHYALPIALKLEEIPTLRGTNLYVLYSDLCDKDMKKVSELCMNCPNVILEDACSRQDYSGRELVKKYMVNSKTSNTNEQNSTEFKSVFIQPHEMIKGKWYVITDRYNWLVKFEEIIDSIIYSKICCDISKNSTVNMGKVVGKTGVTKITDNIIIRPATIEEVNKFVPNEFKSDVTEHPNII